MELPNLARFWDQAVHWVLVLTNKVPDYLELYERANDKNGKEWTDFINALRGIKRISD